MKKALIVGALLLGLLGYWRARSSRPNPSPAPTAAATPEPSPEPTPDLIITPQPGPPPLATLTPAPRFSPLAPRPHWLGRCANDGSCRLVGYQERTSPSVALLLQRPAGATTFDGRIALRPAVPAVALGVNGESLGEIALNAGRGPLTADQTARLLAALGTAPAPTVQFQGGGQVWTLATAEAAAALAQLDAPRPGPAEALPLFRYQPTSNAVEFFDPGPAFKTALLEQLRLNPELNACYQNATAADLGPFGRHSLNGQWQLLRSEPRPCAARGENPVSLLVLLRHDGHTIGQILAVASAGEGQDGYRAYDGGIIEERQAPAPDCAHYKLWLWAEDYQRFVLLESGDTGLCGFGFPGGAFRLPSLIGGQVFD